LATASAPGLVVRAADNAVALGRMATGASQPAGVLLYYHLAAFGVTG